MGSSSITGDETIGFFDNMSFDGTPRDGKMTTNAQIWVGSTIAPHVKLGTITSPDSSLTIGYSSPNITLQANGSMIGETITGNTGGALSPTAGNWNIYGGTVAAGTTPIATSGTGSTLTVNAQISQAVAGTDATRVGLANFSNADFAVDANGFVTASATGLLKTLTPNSGTSPVVPTGGTISVLGDGSITTVGGTNTLTAQLTGLTQYNVLIGQGTTTIGVVAPSATSGVPLISQGAAANPVFGTAVVAGGGTGNTTFTAYSVICAGTTATGAFQNVSGLGSAGQVLTSNGAAALPTWQPAAGGAFPWTDVSGVVNAAVNNGYFVTATCTSTLPGSPSQGDRIAYNLDTTNILTIQANTGQRIRIGLTLSAAAGTCVSIARGDAVTLVYRTSGATWHAQNVVGTWSIT